MNIKRNMRPGAVNMAAHCTASNWAKLIQMIEESTGLKVDSAYRRRPDQWIQLIDETNGMIYDAEINQYLNKNGSYDYEFRTDNMSVSSSCNCKKSKIDECDRITAAYRDDNLYEDDFDDSDGDWEELATKSVQDSDGFMTDYTLYVYTGDPDDVDGYIYICMFGDKDVYEPDEGYSDWSGETEEEAWDWFNNYESYMED